MPASPAVSVCVPTYNGEAYLAECLDSILAQTFADFEVLVVDDCSRDGTLALAEAYARRDSRVRVVSNEQNRGLVGNWNRCVDLARGEWIKFVFQDDLIAPACLERMLAAGRNGHVLVACARDFIFEPGMSEGAVSYYNQHRALLDGLLSASVSAERFSELTIDHLDVNLLGEPTVVLLHRSVFDKFGRFNDYMVQVVDAEYWARIATVVGAAYIPEPLATFRVHPLSTTSLNSNARQARKQLDALVVRHEYAFAPQYEALRAAAAQARPGFDLEHEFWRAAYLTLVSAGVAEALAQGDEKTAAEARRVFAAYPRMRRIPWRYAVRYAPTGYVARHPNAARVYRLGKRAVMGMIAPLGVGR